MKPENTNQAGKGDAPRPIDLKAYQENYDHIFRKQVWPHDPEPFESEDHDNDETIYKENIQ